MQFLSPDHLSELIYNSNLIQTMGYFLKGGNLKFYSKLNNFITLQ